MPFKRAARDDGAAAGAPPPAARHITKRLLLALIMGTVIEWYDFTVYSQLSATLTQVFFPKNDPAAALLAVWGVYALGFVSRPAGSILFGHIADRFGRRPAMLWSIAAILVPTATIGALPTHASAGAAAPALLAACRFAQGLAVGGEWGACVVYLHEAAPPGRAGLYSSLAQAAIAPGMVLGIAVVEAVLLAVPPGDLAVWGWRIPFLLTLATAPISIIFRMRMPEPAEFITARREAAREAAIRAAVGRLSSSRRPGGRPPSRAWSRGPAAPGARACSGASRLEVAVDGMGGAAKAACRLDDGAFDVEHGVMAAAAAVAAADAAATEEGARAAAAVGHVPLVRLLRGHWRGVALQVLWEAHMEAAFYTVFSWAPSYLALERGVPTKATLPVLVLGLAAMIVACTLTGHAADHGMRPMWCYLALTLVLAAMTVPTLLYGIVPPAGRWVLVPLIISIAGALAAVVTVSGPRIYPPEVRTSGFAIGHNLSATLCGGLMPLIVSSAALKIHPSALAAGAVVTALAAVSVVALVGLLFVAPDTNAPLGGGRGPAGAGAGTGAAEGRGGEAAGAATAAAAAAEVWARGGACGQPAAVQGSGDSEV